MGGIKTASAAVPPGVRYTTFYDLTILLIGSTIEISAKERNPMSITVSQSGPRSYVATASPGVSRQRIDAEVRRVNRYARIVTGAVPDRTRRGASEPKIQVRVYSV